MSERRVEETIMQYTEIVFWEGDEVVATERMDDDHSFDIRETRQPTAQELSAYYDQEGM